MTFFHPAAQLVFDLRRVLFVWLVGCVVLAATTTAVRANPLARGVYVADVVGTAWVLDANTGAWSPVRPNQIISPGAQLRSAALSRVTVRAGSSTLWLDAQTELRVLQASDNALALRLLAGDIALRTRDAQVARASRVQTREGVVSQPMEGLVRMGQGHRATRVGVLQGRAQFDSDPGAPLQRAWLREGEHALFVWDDAARMERQTPSQDAFGAWFMQRDRGDSGLALQHAQPYDAVPEMPPAVQWQPSMGQGVTVIEYGQVLLPTQVVPPWYRHHRTIPPLRPRLHTQP